MKIFNLITLLSGLVMLAGCASTPALPTINSPVNVPDTIDQSGSASAEIDSDRDSIADSDDICSDTDRRALVDVTGCEIVMGPVEGLNFGPGEANLNANAEQALDRYVEAMIRYPDVVISVEAHTDNRGTAASNLELSKERVLSVVRYMVSGGVGSDRIKPFGYGESRPRAANATAEGREQNRRIEIKVVEGLS